MMTDEAARQNEALDLLVDGPSSFAALYRTLNKMSALEGAEKGNVSLSVEGCWETVRRLEVAGWVDTFLMRPGGSWANLDELDREPVLARYTRWLPGSSDEETAVDEVGVWLRISAAGRQHWAAWADVAGDRSARWMLDQDLLSSTVTVWAEDLDTAEAGLNEWIARGGIRLIESSREAGPVQGFTLRSGAEIQGGVRLSYRYSKK